MEARSGVVSGGVVGCTGCGARHEVGPEHLRILPQLSCPTCGGRLTRAAGATAQVNTPHAFVPPPSESATIETTVDGPPTSLPAAAPPAKRIGRYELRDAIGQGGFGMVYRAWDPQHEREVALKVLLQPGDRAERRFAQEIKAAARLRHPNIVTLLDSGQVDGRPYLVMELVSGGSLAERSLDLTVDQQITVLRDLARAIDYAHGEGVLHRDIKPDNVLLDDDGRPRLVDLGLARILGASSARLTQAGEAYGTPAYMAPEQAGYGKGGADQRSDVYSLGATLYHCLTGCPPFDQTGIELFLAMFREDPVPLRERDPDLPVALETICATCLSKQPQDRYATAGELADDLDRYLAQEPIAAQPLTPLLRFARWGRNHRSLLGGATMGLAVGLLVGAVTTIGLRDPAPAPVRHVAATPEEERADVVATATAEATPEPAQRPAEVVSPARVVVSKGPKSKKGSPSNSPDRSGGTPASARKTKAGVDRDASGPAGKIGEPQTDETDLNFNGGKRPIKRIPNPTLRKHRNQVTRELTEKHVAVRKAARPEPAPAGPTSSEPAAPTPDPAPTGAQPSAPDLRAPIAATSGALLAILAVIGLLLRRRRGEQASAEEALARWQAGRLLKD